MEPNVYSLWQYVKKPWFCSSTNESKCVHWTVIETIATSDVYLKKDGGLFFQFSILFVRSMNAFWFVCNDDTIYWCRFDYYDSYRLETSHHLWLSSWTIDDDDDVICHGQSHWRIKWQPWSLSTMVSNIVVCYLLSL